MWGFLFFEFYQGIARTQSPTTKNCALELPAFGVIAGVSPTGVQWKGLALGEPPCWSRCPPCQVSMLWNGRCQSPLQKLSTNCGCCCPHFVSGHSSQGSVFITDKSNFPLDIITRMFRSGGRNTVLISNAAKSLVTVTRQWANITGWQMLPPSARFPH